MTPLEQVKVLTGKSEESRITLLLEKAKREIETYTKRTYTTNMDSLSVDMVVVKINRLGTEGLKSQNYSGVSESYTDGYPKDIMDQLDEFKKKVGFV